MILAQWGATFWFPAPQTIPCLPLSPPCVLISSSPGDCASLPLHLLYLCNNNSCIQTPGPCLLPPPTSLLEASAGPHFLTFLQGLTSQKSAVSSLSFSALTPLLAPSAAECHPHVPHNHISRPGFTPHNTLLVSGQVSRFIQFQFCHQQTLVTPHMSLPSKVQSQFGIQARPRTHTPQVGPAAPPSSLLTPLLWVPPALPSGHLLMLLGHSVLPASHSSSCLGNRQNLWPHC